MTFDIFEYALDERCWLQANHRTKELKRLLSSKMWHFHDHRKGKNMLSNGNFIISSTSQYIFSIVSIYVCKHHMLLCIIFQVVKEMLLFQFVNIHLSSPCRKIQSILSLGSNLKYLSQWMVITKSSMDTSRINDEKNQEEIYTFVDSIDPKPLKCLGSVWPRWPKKVSILSCFLGTIIPTMGGNKYSNSTFK